MGTRVGQAMCEGLTYQLMLMEKFCLRVNDPIWNIPKIPELKFREFSAPLQPYL